jgi:hypothetical protein
MLEARLWGMGALIMGGATCYVREPGISRVNYFPKPTNSSSRGITCSTNEQLQQQQQQQPVVRIGVISK